MTKRKGRPLWQKVLLALLLLAAAAVVYECVRTQNPYTLAAKRYVKYELLGLSTVSESRETAGLDGWEVTDYVDGAETDGGPDLERDSKRVYRTGGLTRLVNYQGGYQIDLPAGAEFDFTASPLYVKAVWGDDYGVTISREQATYASAKEIITFELDNLFPFLPLERGVEEHVDYYEFRFLLDEGWQQANGVTVTREDHGRLKLIHAVLENPGDARWDGYTYAVLYNDSREYLRIAFRYDARDTAFRDSIAGLLSTARMFDPVGQGAYTTDFAPTEPGFWSEETRALYQDICAGQDIRWGIFAQDIYETGIEERIPALEEKLDYTFPVVLSYVHFGTAFPTAFMQDCWEQGRIVELTYQITENNNEDMYVHTPFLDVYRGLEDEEIRAFARAAAEFGHPFLFRLCNEMNSDWTSYSGVVNLCDPDVYIAVWQRFYRIFEEEGVDNCIWIYNPNDRNAPPSNWNDALAFYPGNEYVQMFGITGYNNGTYYTQWTEEWREFDAIYDEIWDHCSPHFSRFPWIITEFASSSVGGDKAAWITNMFEHIGDYPNVKIAVWFSYADFDGDTPARPYWLDETEETVAAFRDGLHAAP